MKSFSIMVLMVAAASAWGWLRGEAPPVLDLSAFEDGGEALRRRAVDPKDGPGWMRLRWEVARTLSGFLAGLALVGLAAGMVYRGRARIASPTAAWVAKRLVVAGIGLSALFCTAPIDLGILSLYLAGAGIALGVGVYAGNLPRRL